MAAYENSNNGASGGSNSSSKASVFNRSLTTVRSNPQSNPYFSVLNRVGSIKGQTDSKLYNSIESVVFAGNSIKGKVKKLCSLFESARNQNSASGNLQLPSPNRALSPKLDSGGGMDKKVSIRLPGTEDRIVLYFTSLRGVRRTFEDCYAVRMIFKGFRVWVDERDISMDSAYRKELQSIMGQKNVSLPQVFIRGELVGGADILKSMYETGELAKMLQGFPKQKPGFVCESCGDVRFVPCGNCNGSRKIFDEDEGMLKRCLECNENGLIRCPDCCI